MAEFNKLVRDRIPEIIAEKDVSVTCHKVKGDKAINDALFNKLGEETKELQQAFSDYFSSGNSQVYESAVIEEMADVLEVLSALCFHAPICSLKKQVEEKRQEKLSERGGFEKMWFLESTSE